MKFSVEFDSPDTADICAAAIRSRIGEISSIKIDNVQEVFTGRRTSTLPAFNVSGNNPSYSYPENNPIYNTMDIDMGIPSDYIHNRPKVEIICRDEDAKMVSNIIVGYGGLNIRKTH